MQLDKDGKLCHLLTLENLPIEIIDELFKRANKYIDNKSNKIVKSQELTNKLVVTAFYEASTRTRLSFEIASKSLGAEVVNFEPGTSSEASKGELFEDTLKTISALGANYIVLRIGGLHSSGTEIGLTGRLDDVINKLPNQISLISGGEDKYEHPSQALLDVWTIEQVKGSVSDLKIVINGDINHSRVARSLNHIFKIKQPRELIMCGPEHLVNIETQQEFRVDIDNNLDSALADADVIICLRNQYERMKDESKQETKQLANKYTLNTEKLKLAKSDSMVMHPGPINRNTEITDEVADGPQSYILKQVTNGIAMRMAILSMLA